MPSQRTSKQIESAFTYHAPRPDQVPRYTEIRNRAKAFAEYLASTCPESRELALALTHLEESVMFANAAIARHDTGAMDSTGAPVPPPANAPEAAPAS